jgi:hypothetical protein
MSVAESFFPTGERFVALNRQKMEKLASVAIAILALRCLSVFFSAEMTRRFNIAMLVGINVLALFVLGSGIAAGYIVLILVNSGTALLKENRAADVLQWAQRGLATADMVGERQVDTELWSTQRRGVITAIGANARKPSDHSDQQSKQLADRALNYSS